MSLSSEPVVRPSGRTGLAAWLEVVRPFSFTASVIPVLVGLATALAEGGALLAAFPLALLGAVAIQAGTNVTNEYYDVLNGVDTPATPRASRVVLERRLDPEVVRRSAYLFYGFALLCSLVVAQWTGPAVIGLTLLGCVAGHGYTAPPLQYKYRALGAVAVFFLMGPLMVVGAHYALTGNWSPLAGWLAVPVGFLVTAILYANEVRDLHDDAASRVRTLPHLLGETWARRLYVAMVGAAYLWLAAGVLTGAFPVTALLPWLTLPPAIGVMRTMLTVPLEAMPTIDQATAKLHLLFGLLLALGVAAHGILARG